LGEEPLLQEKDGKIFNPGIANVVHKMDYALGTNYFVNFIISKYCKYSVIFLHCRVVYSTFRELEPCEVKVSRTVLRGQGRGNPPELPDKKTHTNDEGTEKVPLEIREKYRVKKISIKSK